MTALKAIKPDRVEFPLGEDGASRPLRLIHVEDNWILQIGQVQITDLTPENFADMAVVSNRAQGAYDLIVKAQSDLHEILALPASATIARAKALAQEALGTLGRILP